MAVHINLVACLKMSIFQIVFACILTYIFAAPQQPEIKASTVETAVEIPEQTEQLEANQLQTTDHDLIRVKIHDSTTANPDASPDTTVTNHIEILKVTTPQKEKREILQTTTQQPFTKKLYTIVALPIKRFIASPKVNSVLRNIGTCVVNGAMEIISHFFPTPLIPLIASAAGMIIPFEPVVLLKERMPVTSYRRAFKTAVNSFMDTFDRYKVDDQYDDPYMTRRFNRRFMNGDVEKIKRAKET